MSFKNAIGFFAAQAASYPAALANRHFWFDPSDAATITGFGGVATRVNDKLGNGNDLVTGSCTSVSNTLLLNGIDQYMKTAAIAAMQQPTMLYMIVKQVTWTANDMLCDGNTNFSFALQQSGTTPNLRANYNAAAFINNNALALNTWGIVRMLFDGVSSKLIINTTEQTGALGTTVNAGGFTLGRIGGAATYFAHAQYKDVIAMPSTASETEIYNWLVTRL